VTAMETELVITGNPSNPVSSGSVLSAHVAAKAV
jgi:hypothetical protein